MEAVVFAADGGFLLASSVEALRDPERHLVERGTYRVNGREVEGRARVRGGDHGVLVDHAHVPPPPHGAGVVRDGAPVRGPVLPGRVRAPARRHGLGAGPAPAASPARAGGPWVSCRPDDGPSPHVNGPMQHADDRRHVALIRGINVGRAKRVAMADLRALVEGLGYTDVRTLLNSGNVVFTAPGGASSEAAARLEEGMATRLGVSARVTVLDAAELAAVVAENPLRGVASDPSRLLVAVLRDPADRARLEPLMARAWTPEVLALGPRVAYLWCADGILASRLPEAVGRALGDGVTTRNWATVTKLHTLVGG
jgi:uncharacterized protein (DUF1697 family)